MICRSDMGPLCCLSELPRIFIRAIEMKNVSFMHNFRIMYFMFTIFLSFVFHFDAMNIKFANFNDARTQNMEMSHALTE